MLDKNKQNTIRSQEIWTDTKMISRLLEKLEALYREVLQPESVLMDLERSAAQPDLFHHCIAYIVETELQKGPAVKEPAYYENILIKFCKDMLHLTEEQLYAYVHIDDILIPRYDDKELNSISGALAELSILCHKLADEVNHQRLWLSHTANQETYKRYKDYCSAREKLDFELQRTPQLRYSSKHLLTDIADELTDWYQHVDTIKRDNLKRAKELGESPCNEDRQVRINKKVAPDKAKGLPRHFNFEWITSEIEQLEKQNCTELQNRLLHIVRQYLFKCEAPEEVKPNKLKEYINQILALSFMEIFSLSCENTSDSIENIPVTLAPVISYTIIRHGLRQIAAGKELQLPMRVLISQAEPAENPNDISANLWLFWELCSAYGKYYGKRYTKTVQSLWDAAFLVYSGYQKIYASPNLLRTVNAAEKSSQLPEVYCFGQIMRSLEANRVSLEHSPVRRKGHSRWPPVPDTLEPEALLFFRRKLEEDSAQSSEPLLEQYQSFLMNPYSHEGMREFLKESLKRLFPQTDNMSEQEHQELVCKQCGLYNQNGVSYWETYAEPLLKAAIEFTLRSILEESCARRLYKWLTNYIDILCEEASD